MKTIGLRKWLFRLFAIVALVIGSFYVSNAYLFEEGDGLCCQASEPFCFHPEFGPFEDSIWTPGQSTCTTGGGGSGSGGSGGSGDPGGGTHH